MPFTKKEIAKGVIVAGAIEGLELLSEGPIGILSGAVISTLAGVTIAGRARLRREKKEFEEEKKKLREVM